MHRYICPVNVYKEFIGLYYHRHNNLYEPHAFKKQMPRAWILHDIAVTAALPFMQQITIGWWNGLILGSRVLIAGKRMSKRPENMGTCTEDLTDIQIAILTHMMTCYDPLLPSRIC